MAAVAYFLSGLFTMKVGFILAAGTFILIRDDAPSWMIAWWTFMTGVSFVLSAMGFVAFYREREW